MARKSGEKSEKKYETDKKEKQNEKTRNARKKKKSEKPEASAVAKPTDDGVSKVSVEEKDDQPSDDAVDWADQKHEAGDQKHEAGTKDESAQYTDGSEYEPSVDDNEGQRERQRKKEHAKFRRAKPDLGDSSDESSSPPSSPMKGARQKAKELSRDIKAARDPATQKRSHGSSVANPSKRAYKNPAVAASSSQSSAVAATSSKVSTVVSSDKDRLTPKRVNDLEGDWYGKRDMFQNLSGIGNNDSRAFRERQQRRGEPNQRNRELHFPQSVWMVDRDCPAAEIDERIFGETAKNPHVLLVFVDMAIGEQSKAHDRLCMLADESTENRVTCSDSKLRRTSRSGPKKILYRLGRGETTYAFAVIHNRWVSQAIYYDHQGLHQGENDLLRFGTLHVLLCHDTYDPIEKDICLGVISVRRSVDSKTTFDKSDAQMLAMWTQQETHDMVIACTARETCAVEVWQYFGNTSGATHNCPLYQLLRKPPSAVATKSSSSDGDPFGPAPCEILSCPQFVFLYGEVTKVNLPLASQIRPFKSNSIREGRLAECVVESSEVPTWLTPPRTDFAHRQALGEVSIKAIQWDKSPELVLPLSFWCDYPSKTIVNNNSDATSTAKGKGKGTSTYQDNYIRTDKANDKYKDNGKRTDTDEDKRTRLQQSQKQRMQSVTQTSRPQPPPLPLPSHEPKPPRTRSPTRHPSRRARSASPPRRRSPSRRPSRSSQAPQTPSHSPPPRKEASRSGLLMPQPKMLPVASTKDVRRPRVELYPHQHPKAAIPLPAPSRSPFAERHTTVKRWGTIAHEFPYSKASRAPEDPVERAKYVADHTPAFVQGYRRWMAEAPDERGPHTEASSCSEEDDTGIIEEEEEFETKMDHQPARVAMVPRRSIGQCPPWLAKSARGQARCRSRSLLRTRYNNPPASEQRRPLAQRAKPYPWAQPSSSSTSVRAESLVRGTSPVRAFSPRHRGRSPTQSKLRKYPEASHAKYVVMQAKRVKFQ